MGLRAGVHHVGAETASISPSEKVVCLSVSLPPLPHPHLHFTKYLLFFASALTNPSVAAGPDPDLLEASHAAAAA